MKPRWCPILACVLIGSWSTSAQKTAADDPPADKPLEIDKPARAEAAPPAVDRQKSRNDLPGDKPLIDKPARAEPAAPVVDGGDSIGSTASENGRTESDFTLANTAANGGIVVVDRSCSPHQPDQRDKGDWVGWPFDSSGLSGDWLGARNTLQDNGVFVEGVYTSFLEYNFEGGSDTGFFGGGLASASVTIDTQKLLGLKDGVFFINYQNWGWYNDIFQNTDSFDPTSNDTGSNGNFPDAASVNQISQLYYSQHLFDDLLNVAFEQDATTSSRTSRDNSDFLYSGAGYTSHWIILHHLSPGGDRPDDDRERDNDLVTPSAGSTVPWRIERHVHWGNRSTPTPRQAVATFFDNQGTGSSS